MPANAASVIATTILLMVPPPVFAPFTVRRSSKVSVAAVIEHVPVCLSDVRGIHAIKLVISYVE
jgi:hypothetical protein